MFQLQRPQPGSCRQAPEGDPGAGLCEPRQRAAQSRVREAGRGSRREGGGHLPQDRSGQKKRCRAPRTGEEGLAARPVLRGRGGRGPGGAAPAGRCEDGGAPGLSQAPLGPGAPRNWRRGALARPGSSTPGRGRSGPVGARSRGAQGPARLPDRGPEARVGVPGARSRAGPGKVPGVGLGARRARRSSSRPGRAGRSRRAGTKRASRARYLGTQLGLEPSTSQVANRFMGTGVLSAPGAPARPGRPRSAMAPAPPLPRRPGAAAGGRARGGRRRGHMAGGGRAAAAGTGRAASDRPAGDDQAAAARPRPARARARRAPGARPAPRPAPPPRIGYAGRAPAGPGPITSGAAPAGSEGARAPPPPPPPAAPPAATPPAGPRERAWRACAPPGPAPGAARAGLHRGLPTFPSRCRTPGCPVSRMPTAAPSRSSWGPFKGLVSEACPPQIPQTLLSGALQGLPAPGCSLATPPLPSPLPLSPTYFQSPQVI